MLLMHLETMRLLDTRFAISILQLLLLLVVIVGADPTPKVVQKNGTKRSLSSPWLRRVINPRAAGCWNRPWICNEGQFPPRIKKLCCRNQCVDVTSDVYNCGLCGISVSTNAPLGASVYMECVDMLSHCPHFLFLLNHQSPRSPQAIPTKAPVPPKPFPPKPFPPHPPKGVQAPTMA
ncbi:hypothetical protein CK203_041383 [Vitis vinifera]|uniref:Uncharacterized protein n=1 Tax=Vitis vinifera TaxID=29760 RepID=A0A438H5L7_VITVI|nr:hypothetical protein CK203_041383 [Vitis vinifera]